MSQEIIPFSELHLFQSLAHSAVARPQEDAITMNTVGSQQGVFSPRSSNATLQFFHDVFEEVVLSSRYPCSLRQDHHDHSLRQTSPLVTISCEGSQVMAVPEILSHIPGI
jgi:hypothetical protein